MKERITAAELKAMTMKELAAEGTAQQADELDKLRNLRDALKTTPTPDTIHAALDAIRQHDPETELTEDDSPRAIKSELQHIINGIGLDAYMEQARAHRAPWPTDTDTDTEEEEEEETMFTNYTEAVTEDAAQYIRDNYTAEEIAEKLTDREEFAETLNDEMWIADEVTGNGSGSYTFDRAQAREYVLADIDTVKEALKEFDTPAETIAEKFLGDDWEYFDVTARCYVLSMGISEVLDEIEKEAI